MRIELRQFGKVFSGRSRATEIVSMITVLPLDEVVEVDLSEVEWATKSFISELLFQLRNRGIDPESVKFSGVADAELEGRIIEEFKRFSSVSQAS